MSRQLSAVMALFVIEALGTLLTGCRNPAVTVSDGALRNATANGAATELRGIGYRLRHRLRCRTPAGNTPRVVQVHCAGTTVDGRPVRVDGIAYDADTRHPHQEFVILVSGQEVVRTPCLGLGCSDRS
jgi:hypothetical protein